MRKFLWCRSGATAYEYGLIAMLVSVLLIAAAAPAGSWIEQNVWTPCVAALHVGPLTTAPTEEPHPW